VRFTVLILLSVFLVGVASAGDRPFDFSVNKDTSKAKVLVTEGNRMVDDIYSQFEAKDGVLRLRKFQIVSITHGFDSIGAGAINEDTVKIRNFRNQSVRFKDTTYRVYATQRGLWADNDRGVVGIGLAYWYPINDSTLAMAVRYDNVWDTLDVLIFGEMK
jgi:hypothetical protein